MSDLEVKGNLLLNEFLLGRKVSLRPFAALDITPKYIGWLNDPQVVRFSNQRFRIHTFESCHAYLLSFEGSANNFLAICDLETSSMLGTITVHRSVNHGTADIGIMIGERSFWSKGIGADAFCTVMAKLIESGEIRKVTAGSLAVNISMVRIMERAGMKLEATRYDQEIVQGVPVNVVYYAKFRDD